MSQALDELSRETSEVIMNTYGRYPIGVERAEGCRIFDVDGREYIDLLAGIAVVGLGHGREDLAEVMAAQARRLVHVSNLFYQREQVELARKLLGTCDADKVFFCNSGAEANEAAIKLARRYTRKVKNKKGFEVITLEKSFHGRTLATVTATGQPVLQDGFDPLPAGFKHVPVGDMETMRQAVSEDTCAIMIEMVQGEGGVLPLDKDYVDQIVALAREKDLLLMVDEVQTGLCRTGKFWAHQHYGIIPDIFTSAKALANGLPMGACLATDEVASGFEPGCHATTFGAGAVLCKVASRVLDVMIEEDLAGRAKEMGEFALGEFGELMDRHPDKIKGLRGLGLMLGIELAFPGQEVFSALMDKGFILNLTQGNILRLVPPLVIEKDDILCFCKALDEILAEINTSRDD